MDEYSVSIEKIIDELQLGIVYMPPEKSVLVSRAEVNRPGLALSGFFGHFEAGRLQIIGKGEHEYITSFDPITRKTRINDFMSRNPVAVIYTTGLDIHPELEEAAEEYGIPVLTTTQMTSEFMAALIAFLNLSLAPRITRHGVLVEVYGEGLLIIGDSGIGKSETAIELVKRGHRFIADDAVEIKKVSSKTLVGTAPDLIKYYVELRGIGIVDVRRIFGMGAVKETEKVDLVINLEPWVQGKMYDRFGVDTEEMTIMGITVPMTTIPVKPGRNLAIILEIAAMNNRQKKMGYDTAAEFNKILMGQMNVEK
ncbi:MAG: HPr(Ser) kinase/phosphatase [Eubacteriales bacterium]|jgi:HPr kinase/phosphorylase|nr:HPr(Ser) kinase/phosphatase [Eubacteriales bacterium]